MRFPPSSNVRPMMPADYGGARIESFDLVRAATEDFVAPITDAAERLTGEN
jgi:hypothetical protein